MIDTGLLEHELKLIVEWINRCQRENVATERSEDILEQIRTKDRVKRAGRAA